MLSSIFTAKLVAIGWFYIVSLVSLYWALYLLGWALVNLTIAARPVVARAASGIEGFFEAVRGKFNEVVARIEQFREERRQREELIEQIFDFVNSNSDTIVVDVPEAGR
jgi:hypothetical protein